MLLVLSKVPICSMAKYTFDLRSQKGRTMIVWQAIEVGNDFVLIQSDNAKELASLLSVSPNAIYMAWYRKQTCRVKKPGRNKKYTIQKVVIEDD